MPNRRVQLRVAYAPGFEEQSAINVPLDEALLTEVLTTREGGQSHIEPIHLKEDIKDCTTEYLLDRLVLHRFARLTLDLEVDTELLSGIFGHTMGVTAGSNISMLPPADYELPLTTFIVGFADGEDPGILFYDAVTESLTLTARVEQKMRVQWVLVGSAAMPNADGFTFPECDDINPLRFDQNALVTVNSVEYIQTTRGFELQYNNAVPLSDFPWTLGALDVKRMERGDFRTVVVNWTVEGRENDDLGVAARAVPPTHYDFNIRIGSASDGIEIIAADTLFEFGNPFQGFDGEVSLAVLNIMMTPCRIPGDNSTPLTVAVNS